MTTAIKVFLGLAIFPYPFVLWMTWFIRGKADGLPGGFATLGVMVVWLNLSIALLLAGIENGIPWWSYVLAVPVILIYLGAVYSVTELLRTERVQWMIVVPAVGPLVMFAYIWWASMPHTRGLKYYETRDLALNKMRASKRKESDLRQMIQSGDHSLVAWPIFKSRRRRRSARLGAT